MALLVALFAHAAARVGRIFPLRPRSPSVRGAASSPSSLSTPSGESGGCGKGDGEGDDCGDGSVGEGPSLSEADGAGGDCLTEDSVRKLSCSVRTGRIALDGLLVLSLAACVVSGLMVSGEVLPAFGVYATGYFFWAPLHAASAKALFALLLVHLFANLGIFRKG